MGSWCSKDCQSEISPAWALWHAVNYVQNTYGEIDYVIISGSALAAHLTEKQYLERNRRHGRESDPRLVRDVDMVVQGINKIHQIEYVQICCRTIEIDMWDMDMSQGERQDQSKWWDQYNRETFRTAETKYLELRNGTVFPVKVATIEQIVKLKLKLGRKKDYLDIAYLEELGLIQKDKKTVL